VRGAWTFSVLLFACSSAKEAAPRGDDGLPLPPRTFEEDSGSSSSGEIPDATTPDPSPPTDAGVDAAGPGCNGLADCERIVFVTRGTFIAGAIGGIAGADAKCQAAADTSTVPRIKGRIFRAWISAGGVTPATRFPQGVKPYILANNTIVANNWADLTDGNLRNGINRDELGQGVDNFAWTGTQTNGTEGGMTCTGWASTTGGGLRGNVGGDGNGWTESQNAACTAANHLYCFEQ